MDITKPRSPFKEMAQHYAQGARHADKVLEARYNKSLLDFGKLDAEKMAEADRRTSLCLDCPFNSVRAKTSPEFLALYGGHYYTNRSDSDLHCSHCSCDIDYKVLAFSDPCGLKHYNDNHPENPQPLYFGVFPAQPPL